KVQRPREAHKPYNWQSKLPKNGQLPPRTSTFNPADCLHHHLALHDWLQVIAYFDQHQPISQKEVVKHFTSKKDGVLIFTQSSLSQHLSKAGCAADKERLESHPTALSSKQIRVVTWADIEALFK
ncbi:hypothetical protein J3R82DRAFT_4736, partial [Butyriboletus roseoflavus]